MDSTGVMELIMFLEETSRLKLEDEDPVPESLGTISGIARFVEQKVAEGGDEEQPEAGRRDRP